MFSLKNIDIINMRQIIFTLMLLSFAFCCNYDYYESIMARNFLDLAVQDINQTTLKINKGGEEKNLIAKPFVDAGNPTFPISVMLGQVYLNDRWAKMDNRFNRKIEMTTAVILENAALIYSGEPFKFDIGIEF